MQVAAFSDEATAKDSWQELVDQGFPAYLISAPTAQGQIYRIRIGTFANREAAALFAASMQGLSGSNPSPALAENIPGEYLFQANLLGAYDLNTTICAAVSLGRSKPLCGFKPKIIVDQHCTR